MGGGGGGPWLVRNKIHFLNFITDLNTRHFWVSKTKRGGNFPSISEYWLVTRDSA